MKKLTVLLLAITLVLGAGCVGGDTFKAVDAATREDLLAFLATAALGGRGENTIIVDGEISSDIVSEVSGHISGSADGAEMVSLGFYDGKVVEVARCDVSAEGKWGPLTLVNGPKALVLLKGEETMGYYVDQPRFAADLTAGLKYAGYRVNPLDTGLVALALVKGGKLQEAADLLAGLQRIHRLHSGLPVRVDVFGNALGEEVDYTATAWAGYAAAVLARTASDNADIWNEAKAYASYLEGIDPPPVAETRLGGWLLFTELSKKESAYGQLADKWQPEAGEEYDPLVGTWMLLAKGKAKDYADPDYQPVSATDRWIHYNLLAALKKVPVELDLATAEVPGGRAVIEEGRASLQATSWMVIALMGGL